MQTLTYNLQTTGLLSLWWLYTKTKWYKPTTQKLLDGAKPYYELWELIEKLEKQGHLPKSKKKNKVKLNKSLYQLKK